MVLSGALYFVGRVSPRASARQGTEQNAVSHSGWHGVVSFINDQQGWGLLHHHLLDLAIGELVEAQALGSGNALDLAIDAIGADHLRGGSSFRDLIDGVGRLGVDPIGTEAEVLIVEIDIAETGDVAAVGRDAARRVELIDIELGQFGDIGEGLGETMGHGVASEADHTRAGVARFVVDVADHRTVVGDGGGVVGQRLRSLGAGDVLQGVVEDVVAGERVRLLGVVLVVDAEGHPATVGAHEGTVEVVHRLRAAELDAGVVEALADGDDGVGLAVLVEHPDADGIGSEVVLDITKEHGAVGIGARETETVGLVAEPRAGGHREVILHAVLQVDRVLNVGALVPGVTADDGTVGAHGVGQGGLVDAEVGVFARVEVELAEFVADIAHARTIRVDGAHLGARVLRLVAVVGRNEVLDLAVLGVVDEALAAGVATSDVATVAGDVGAHQVAVVGIGYIRQLLCGHGSHGNQEGRRQ